MSEEKWKLEDQVQKEKILLSRQLNELKEKYEKEVREKNENIIRLNNILNENCDKSSESKVEIRKV